MANKIILGALFAMLLLLLPCSASAQFYRSKATTADIIRRGIVMPPSAESETVKGRDVADSGKKSAKKSKKASAKKSGAKAKSKAKPKSAAKVKYEVKRYKLGERVIMQGDSGTDVKTLAGILVKKLYLDENDIIYAADGTVLYDGEILRALRTFQKVSGIYSDGIVGSTTVKALRKRK